MVTQVEAAAEQTRDLELLVGGMTCASCASRIEKKLNKLPGVTATVNYAAEKAKVTFGGDVEPADLLAMVEAAGYTAALPAPAPAGSDQDDTQRAGDREADAWRQRLVVSGVLTVPVVLMSMVPALQFDNRQWVSPGLPGRGVGRAAFPPRGLDQRPPRRRDDGHPDLGRGDRGLPV